MYVILMLFLLIITTNYNVKAKNTDKSKSNTNLLQNNFYTTIPIEQYTNLILKRYYYIHRLKKSIEVLAKLQKTKAINIKKKRL